MVEGREGRSNVMCTAIRCNNSNDDNNEYNTIITLRILSANIAITRWEILPNLAADIIRKRRVRTNDRHQFAVTISSRSR